PRRLLPLPYGAQVVARLPEVADGLRPGAAGPDVTVGGEVAAGPTGVAGYDLPLLLHNLGRQPVVAGPEGLGKGSKPLGRHRAGGQQVLHRLPVLLGARGDVAVQRV